MRFGYATSSFERRNPPASKWFVAPEPRALYGLDADRAGAVEQDPRHELARLYGEIRPVQDRVQVRTRGAEPAAAVDRAVERGEAFLPRAVDVVRERVAGLLDGLEE